jgi:uncharacterized protein YdhG (YjbR/CyaY superfamily)
MNDVDTYLQNVEPQKRIILQDFRMLVKKMAPEVQESISYGVPTFKLNKKPLIYMAAFTNHMSVYPASDEMIAFVGDELKKFRTSKGTLQFTLKNQIPHPMLKKIILFRLTALNNK